MDNPRFKLVVILVSLAAVLLVSVIVSRGIGANGNSGLGKTGPWTPIPTATATRAVLVQTETVPTAASSPTPAPEGASATNCTLPLTYWAAHTEAWPAIVKIGDFTYTKDQAVAYSSQPGDAAADLFVQLNAAFLNTMNGADYRQVNETILAAASWLESHAVGSQVSPSDQEAARRLGTNLADYNEGILGPGLCIHLPTPLPPELTATQTATQTPAFSETPAATDTSTVTPTPTPGLPSRLWTDTPEPTQTPEHYPPARTRTATEPSPRPTAAPTRPPTASPTKPPTPPPPTDTQPPPPTDTQPPPPTATQPPPTQLSPPMFVAAD